MPRFLPVVVIPLIAFVLALGSPSADPPSIPSPTTFECRWTERPITIDGVADEPAWNDARAIDRFHIPGLGANDRPAKTATRAKLLWDRDYLYFFADMTDADLFADVTAHDGPISSNDAFELFLKPAADKPGYFQFQINAANAVSDAFFPKRDLTSVKDQKSIGEFRVESKVKLHGTLNQRDDVDEGWSVEGRIPWSDFLRTGGRPDSGDVWQCALCRYDYTKGEKEPELSTIAPIREKKLSAIWHQFEDYATLKFVGPPPGIAKYEPITTSTVVGSPDPPTPYRLKRVLPKVAVSYPIMVAPVPGSDQLFVITQPGPYGPTSLYRFTDAATTTTADAVKLFDTPNGGTAYDIAFHPKFAANGFVYIGWNGPVTGKPGKQTQITRYTMDPKPPYALDPKTAMPIMAWDSDGHNGGAIAFGPDGFLYVTSGDGTADSDGNVTGQRTDLLLAKVLRIDVDHAAAGKAYGVPSDNPFVADPRFVPETWAYGLRNPWRIAADPVTGQVWVGNNGQDLWEQAYLIQKGANYGWSVREGSRPFYEHRTPGPTPISLPTAEHHHAEFRSLTGGHVYRGKDLPGLVGAYLYGDYSTGRIWGIKHDGTKIEWHKELVASRLQITAFGRNSQGELLICDHRAAGESGFYTLEPTPPDDKPSIFPKKLSDSGLYDSVPGHKLKSGAVPYTVNAPFWSDGLRKERYVVLPPNGKIDYTRTNGWNFPDKTVIVKSFATEPGKYVETRFFTKQGAEWYGYSYRWNDAGTDADLVPSAGTDQEITVAGKKQIWHYPSRAECLVCHSRAANFVLGLCELQMNKVHDYNGRVDHQLHVFEKLGLLSIDVGGIARDAASQQASYRGLTGKAADDFAAIHGPQPGQRPPTLSSIIDQKSDPLKKLVDPFDKSLDLNLRARSWLHSNCSSCHIEAGGGNSRINLNILTSADKQKLIGEPPVHFAFDLKDAKLIQPGDPDRSVLFKRISTRGQYQMPPMSSNKIDEAGVALLREWISAMK